MSFEKLREIEDQLKDNYPIYDFTLYRSMIEHRLINLNIINYKDFSIGINSTTALYEIFFNPALYKELLDKYPEEFI